MNVSTAIEEGKRFLTGSGSTETPHLDAELLICHITSQSRSQMIAQPQQTISKAAYHRYKKLLLGRASAEPIAYLTGRQEFYGRTFVIKRSVLVPRPDSETLVSAALNEADKASAIIDIGCGSGCIGLTIASERPDLPVHLVDISQRALQVSKANARRLGLTNVDFHLDDLWPSSVQVRIRDTVVTANLPYVDDRTWQQSTPLQHEPAGALRGGPDGLRLVKRLLRFFKNQQFYPSCLLLELDPNQIQAAAALAWGHIDIFKDLAGRERVLAFYS